MALMPYMNGVEPERPFGRREAGDWRSVRGPLSFFHVVENIGKVRVLKTQAPEGWTGRKQTWRLGEQRLQR